MRLDTEAGLHLTVERSLQPLEAPGVACGFICTQKIEGPHGAITAPTVQLVLC